MVAGWDVLADPASVRARISLTGQFTALDPVLTGRRNADVQQLSAPAPAEGKGEGGGGSWPSLT